MNPWPSQTIVQALGWTLVHFLWQGLVIAALLAIGLRLFRTGPAYYKYLAACAAMALMALAPLVTFRLVLSQPEPLPAITPISAKISPVKTSEVFTLAQPTRAPIPQPRAVGFFERLNHLLPWLVLAWLAGVCALSGRLFVGWLQVRRLRRTATRPLPSPWPERLVVLAQRLAISRPIQLLQSALIEVPTVIGWLRPVILLPANCLTGLTPGQLEAIIAHELAHIRRHDYLVNLLQSTIETLLFYHPAVWWVSRRIRDERENCCDDLAVEVSGDLVGYARALATLEELRPASAQLMLAAAGAPLLQRIRRLAGQPERSAGRAPWPVAGIAVLLVLAILAAGRMEHRAAATPQLTSETHPNKPPAFEVCTFHLDPNTPWQILQSHIGELCPADSNGVVTGTNRGRVVHFRIPATNDDASPLSSLFRAYFVYNGMDFGTNTGKAVIFNESKSTLTIRATSRDMADIEADINFLHVIAWKLQSPGKLIHSTPPPFTIETNADREEPFHVQATNLVYTGKGRQNIIAKLHQIRIDAASYSNLTLPVVLSDFTKKALAHDPDGKGINFFFDRQDPVAGSIISQAAPNDSPASATSTNQFDITRVKVRFALSDVPMDEALEALVKSADHPIRYEILDYAVVFSLIDSNKPPPLEIRTFHLDTKTFLHGLEKSTGIPLANTGDSGEGGPEIQLAALDDSTPAFILTGVKTRGAVAFALREFFTAGGVQLGITSGNPGKVVIFNEFKGTLTVRATSEDIAKIEAAVSILNTPPPSAADNKQPVTNQAQLARLIQDGKFLYETGKYDEAEIKFKQALSIDPSNIPASQYLRLVTEKLQSPRKPIKLVADSAGTTPSPETVDAPMAATNGTKPLRVKIEVKFVELTMKEGKTTGFVWSAGTNSYTNAASAAVSSNTTVVTGLLTAPQFHATINALEQRDGTDVLTAPTATTESGRQAQIQSIDIQQTVTSSGLGFGTNRPVASNANTPAFSPGTTTLSAGPTIDVIPTVSADGKSIDLCLIPSVLEFLGYDQPGNAVRGDFAPAAGVSAPAVPASPPVDNVSGPQASAPVGGVTSVLPLPHYRLRQTTANVTAWDGQTVVISGLATRGSTNTMVESVPLLGNLPYVGPMFRSESTQKIAKKQLLIFVTVTILNPDGTPFHPDEKPKTF